MPKYITKEKYTKEQREALRSILKNIPDLKPEAMKRILSSPKELRRIYVLARYLDFIKVKLPEINKYAYKSYVNKLDNFLHQKPIKKGRGNPRRRVTTSRYIKENIITRFNSYLSFTFKALSENKYNIKGIRKPDFDVFSKDFYRAFRMCFTGSADAEIDTTSTWFNIGANFASFIIYGIVLEILTDEIDEISGRGSIEKALEADNALVPILQMRGFPKEAIEIIMKESQSHLPNDLLRKVRKPVYSRSEINKFVIKVKEIDGIPYVDKVAKKLKLPIPEVHDLYFEAVRQKKLISINPNQNRPFFYV